MEIVKVVNTRPDGSLYHYAHFVMDCLFVEILSDVHKHIKVVRLKNLNQTLGNFANIYQDLLGIENLELEREAFDQVVAKQINTTRIDNPTPEMLQKFRQFIFDHFQLDGPSTVPAETAVGEILLIQRGDRIKLINDSELARRDHNVTTGKERREIKQIEVLKTYLNEHYQQRFRCVMLEHMTFIDQVKAFMQAKMVIGIHGAGLANILFSKPGTVLIEIRQDFKWHFLNNSCRTLAIKHILVNNNLGEITKVINDNLIK